MNIIIKGLVAECHFIVLIFLYQRLYAFVHTSFTKIIWLFLFQSNSVPAKYICAQCLSPCPNWDPPPPLFLASVSPFGTQGGGDTLACRCGVGVHHRVDRVLGFFFSRPCLFCDVYPRIRACMISAGKPNTS